MIQWMHRLLLRLTMATRPTAVAMDREDLWYAFRFRYHHKQHPSELEWASLWAHWKKDGWR